MDEYSQYQQGENSNTPSMVFISKLQPCLKALNAEFLAIKDKVHHGENEGLNELIQQWKSIESPENTRTKIQTLLIENYDELRFDVKVNMYKNHLGGITWIEQVIQRQFYFAKQHFNTQLNDFIKTGHLPLYPERKTDKTHTANKKHLNSMAADYLNILKKLEETFASVYPAYIQTLASNDELNDLIAYPTRIVLDYHSKDRIIEILHDIFNRRFISEIELADFKLHFTCDGFLPKIT
jgi:regulator of sigma D